MVPRNLILLQIGSMILPFFSRRGLKLRAKFNSWARKACVPTYGRSIVFCFESAVRRLLTIYTKLLSFAIDQIIITHKVAIHFLVIRLELFSQSCCAFLSY